MQIFGQNTRDLGSDEVIGLPIHILCSTHIYRNHSHESSILNGEAKRSEQSENLFRYLIHELDSDFLSFKLPNGIRMLF